MIGTPLLEFLRGRREDMLASLAALVEHESPSRDKEALDSLSQTLAARFRAHGADVERITNPTGGDHLRIAFPFEGLKPDVPPSLVLGHFDTVWPKGTLAGMPFRIDGERAYGPGTYDMKASLVLLEYAVAALRGLGCTPPRPIVALLTSDEEIGSPTSRDLIEADARRSAYALVLEGPLPGGRLKTGRKGVGNYTIAVEGRAAHAGVEPQAGVNAIVEMAHQVLKIQGIADPGRGTTLNVGVIRGGTTSNVVPAEAEAKVDVRVETLEESGRVDRAILSMQPVLPGARLKLSGGFNRPPMERTPAIAALFQAAREIGRGLGLDLDEGSTGGASDGNFTAAIGLPTLDGLGALGAGAHAAHEHVLVDSMHERAALLAALLMGL
ncbi:MAG: M20 family metallopeptidase [Isosphaeraceae bacterium]